MTTLDLLRSTEPGQLREWIRDLRVGGEPDDGGGMAGFFMALAEHHAEIVAALEVAEAVHECKARAWSLGYHPLRFTTAPGTWLATDNDSKGAWDHSPSAAVAALKAKLP